MFLIPKAVLTEATSDDRAPPFRAYLIFLTVLTAGSICLRFISRSLRSDTWPSGSYWWDDWLALAATPFIFGMLGASFAMIRKGFGHPIKTLSSDDVLFNLRVIYSGNYLFDTAIVLSKASALLFFSRIFPRAVNNRWFNAALWTVHILNIGWFIGIVVATVFLCDPIAKGWDPSIPGQCNTSPKVYIGSAVTSVSIDLMILLLPLPSIWRLQLKKAQKGGLLIVFLLGYSVIAVSIGRTVTVLRSVDAMNEDVTYAAVPLFYWFETEPVICLVCICLPATVTLGRHVLALYVKPLRSKASSVWQSTTSRPGFRSRSGDFSLKDGNIENVRLRPVLKESPYVSQMAGDESARGFSSDDDRIPFPLRNHNLASVSGGRNGSSDTSYPQSQGVRVKRSVDVDSHTIT
ncbi:hypothetical protein F5B19DRAFT_493322 [Rostrohypoxylon terebratum]|nr:hypothetical protein F5B19DRAFT_493322 [Rostrohypoxylon terebratum]